MLYGVLWFNFNGIRIYFSKYDFFCSFIPSIYLNLCHSILIIKFFIIFKINVPSLVINIFTYIGFDTYNLMILHHQIPNYNKRYFVKYLCYDYK